jgi:hypothetical protein
MLVAQSVLLSGMIAQRIFFQGARLPDFRLEIAGTVGLASRYVTEFDRKWIRGGAPEGEPLVGSADIRSLADLANSFEVVQTMRRVPFGREAVIQLVAASVLPIPPLLLMNSAWARTRRVHGYRLSTKCR